MLWQTGPGCILVEFLGESSGQKKGNDALLPGEQDAVFLFLVRSALYFGAYAHELKGDALRDGHKGTVVTGLVEQLASELVHEFFRHDVGIVHADAQVVEAAGGAVGQRGAFRDFLEEDLHAGERDDGAFGTAEFAIAHEFCAECLLPEVDHGVEVGAAEMDVIKGSHENLVG